MGNVEIFALANLLLALFILVFGLFSLRHVWHSKKRQGPWALMLVMGFVLFVTQALNLLSIAGYYNQVVLRPFMDSLFLMVMLFTIVFQYHLIILSQKGKN